MSVCLSPPSHLASIEGVRIATAAAGIRYKGRDDLVLFELCEEAQTAAVFTQNQFCAAPVEVAQQHLESRQPRYLLINSGNANAGLGDAGILSARSSCSELAKLVVCEAEEILPFSTGVIGEVLPVDKMISNFPALIRELDKDSWLTAAHAIMTTDTVAKGYAEQVDLDGQIIHITGIAKGSGMICPNMATMLAFVATDLKIDSVQLSQLLNVATNISFNCISVDGDTSTNDACVLSATGQSGVSFSELTDGSKEKFVDALNSVFLKLAQAIVRDGEGASKFISIVVEQAKDDVMAKEIAYTIAHSPLVKTAAYASDPNWGRILAATGRARVGELNISKTSLYLNDQIVLEQGQISKGYNEAIGQKEMQKEEIEIRIVLGINKGAAKIWTTDLSHEYVKINAEYRT